MTIKTYSAAKDGSRQLTKNFKVREFACKDGADKVLIDEALVSLLQQIRSYFGREVIINSAYRTVSHNQKVGGSSGSQHLLGKAADIRINGVAPLLLAQYAEHLGAGGIGLYETFVHVDTRASKSRWDYREGKKTVAGFGGQGSFEQISPYRQEVKKRFSLDDNTMDYLEKYKYGDVLLEKLANAE